MMMNCLLFVLFFILSYYAVNSFYIQKQVDRFQKRNNFSQNWLCWWWHKRLPFTYVIRCWNQHGYQRKSCQHWSIWYCFGWWQSSKSCNSHQNFKIHTKNCLAKYYLFSRHKIFVLAFRFTWNNWNAMGSVCRRWRNSTCNSKQPESPCLLSKQKQI